MMIGSGEDIIPMPHVMGYALTSRVVSLEEIIKLRLLFLVVVYLKFEMMIIIAQFAQ